MDKKQRLHDIKIKLNKRETVPSNDDAYIFINAMVGYVNLRAYYHDDPEAIRLTKIANSYGW